MLRAEKGSWGEGSESLQGPGLNPGNIEFGAFWDLEIASKQCNWIKCANETL